MTYVKMDIDANGQRIYCTICKPGEQNVRPQKINTFHEVTTCVFYCIKHDGKFVFLADNGRLKFLPLDGMEDGFYLSDSERERMKDDLDHEIETNKEIVKIHKKKA